ncbi:MAG: menaquinone biosynthesis decarboxylase [Smithella sp.]
MMNKHSCLDKSMSFRNLQEFIFRLEAAGELRSREKPVSPILEITEIADREMKSPEGGKALLFEKVEGSSFPVLINAFGSFRRMATALSADPNVVAERLRTILEQSPPGTVLEKLSMIPKAISWSRFFPRFQHAKNPPCQEVVYTGKEVDLSILPVLHCWPKDGGRFVTLPVVFSKSLKDGRQNAGMYRLQIYDKCTTGMHWHIHKDGSHYFQKYRKAGRRMEVAVAIGTDPAVTYASTAPMPRGVDEMILAGFIRQKPVVMVKALTVDIHVPAEAEFILEGYIDPEETRREGPFGDHTGYYSLEDDYPVFHVTALTHRRNPVYSATIVGRPPMEDCYLAYATERLFLPLIRTVLPEITDYHLPWEGVFHNIVVVAIDKEFPKHAAKVMNSLWGTGQMSFAKAIVVVDNRELLTGGMQLLRHVLETVDTGTDITVTEGILDVLDHSAPQGLYGTKIGIDVTRRVSGEHPRPQKEKPPRRMSDDEILSLLKNTDAGFIGVRTIFPESALPLILITVEKDTVRNSSFFLDRLQRQVLSNSILVIYDASVNLWEDSVVLWKAFNNVDPGRDIIIMPSPVANLIIDATKKGPADGHSRPWPDDIEMSEEIIKLVDKKFPEFRKC